MDRNRAWWGGSGRSQSGGGGLKGRPPPRLAPPEPHAPLLTNPQDDLINYIHDSWDKISREGARVWEPPRPAPPHPPLPPMDLDLWGRMQSHRNNS